MFNHIERPLYNHEVDRLEQADYLVGVTYMRDNDGSVVGFDVNVLDMKSGSTAASKQVDSTWKVIEFLRTITSHYPDTPQPYASEYVKALSYTDATFSMRVASETMKVYQPINNEYVRSLVDWKPNATWYMEFSCGHWYVYTVEQE